MTADRVREFLAWIIQDEASMDRMCRMFAQVKESLKFDTVVLAADGYTGYRRRIGESPHHEQVRRAIQRLQQACQQKRACELQQRNAYLALR